MSKTNRKPKHQPVRVHPVVRALLRDLASRESEVSAFLGNDKTANLPLPHKSRAWNLAFQQGIYEGVRRCEDCLRLNS
jgi:hypothetical protein